LNPTTESKSSEGGWEMDGEKRREKKEVDSLHDIIDVLSQDVE
jgi:hypothetical protein